MPRLSFRWVDSLPCPMAALYFHWYQLLLTQSKASTSLSISGKPTSTVLELTNVVFFLSSNLWLRDFLSRNYVIHSPTWSFLSQACAIAYLIHGKFSVSRQFTAARNSTARRQTERGTFPFVRFELVIYQLHKDLYYRAFENIARLCAGLRQNCSFNSSQSLLHNFDKVVIVRIEPEHSRAERELFSHCFYFGSSLRKRFTSGTKKFSEIHEWLIPEAAKF